MKKYTALLFLLFMVFFVQTSCSTLKLESTWKNRDLIMDGKGGDWLGSKYYFEDSAISVGLINDGQYLYVSMMTENPLIRAQILREGLTVWLDPEGGKNKTFGIKYPIGRQGDEQEKEMMDPQAVMDETAREAMMQKFQEAMSELAIVGSNERVLVKMDIEDAKGIIVKLRDALGTFVYELRIPLASSEEYPYAVGVKAGGVIGLGFLSPKLEMRRPAGTRGGGRMPEGGMGGPGGMGGMGGMPEMGRFMPRQLKIWAKVQLASDENPALSFF
jgi:hypothetical protein